MGNKPQGLRRLAPSTDRVSRTYQLAGQMENQLRFIVGEPNVTQQDIRVAAMNFDDFARSSLEDAGYAPTTANVAWIVGESRTGYADALAGRKCGVQRVFAWLTRWNLAFSPEDTLYLSPCNASPDPLLPPVKRSASARPEKRKKPAGGFTPEKLEELRLMGITLSQTPGGGES